MDAGAVDAIEGTNLNGNSSDNGWNFTSIGQTTTFHEVDSDSYKGKSVDATLTARSPSAARIAAVAPRSNKAGIADAAAMRKRSTPRKKEGAKSRLRRSAETSSARGRDAAAEREK